MRYLSFLAGVAQHVAKHFAATRSDTHCNVPPPCLWCIGCIACAVLVPCLCSVPMSTATFWNSNLLFGDVISFNQPRMKEDLGRVFPGVDMANMLIVPTFQVSNSIAPDRPWTAEADIHSISLNLFHKVAAQRGRQADTDACLFNPTRNLFFAFGSFQSLSSFC